MSPIKLYPTFHYLFVKLIGLTALPITIILYLWNPSTIRYPLVLWPIVGAIFAATLWPNRVLILGGPALEISDHGLKMDGMLQVPWSDVYRAYEFKQYGLIALYAPFHSSPLLKFLPKKMVRRETVILIYQKKFRNSVEQARYFTKSKIQVEERANLPDELKNAIRDLQ